MKALKALLVIPISLQFLLAASQDYSYEFGKPAAFEFEMTEYENDPYAEALVIYDRAKIQFVVNSDNSIDVVCRYQKKVKIFNDAGIEFAEVAIPVRRTNATWERVEDVEAYCYNLEDGIKKIITLDASKIYTEKIHEDYDLIKFAVPGAKSGSIIEYRYTFRTPNKFSLPDWYFQDRIPVVYSEYKVYLVPFYEYIYLLQGAAKFDQHTVEERTGLNHTYGAVSYRELIST